MITLSSYILGSWQEGQPPAALLHDPTTGQSIAQASTRGLELAAALQFGRREGGPALRALTFAQRGALLKRASGALHEAREELIDTSIKNGGTTRSDAKFDIDGAIGTLAFYAKLGEQLGDRRWIVDGEAEKLARSPRFCGFHVKLPLRGVAVHINAFNFPAWGMAEKAACALLAGMPVVTKPATSTALLSFRAMEKLVASDAVPRGAWQLICGSLGDALEQLSGQDVIAFTGSAQTAGVLRRLEAVRSRSVRLNVEADSINAAVLGPDVEPGSDTYQMFLRDTLREIRQKAGQKCTATRRIIAPREQLDRVEADLSAELAAIKVGAPAAEGVQMGPLATRAQLDDARTGVARLLEGGCRLVCGDPDRVELVEADPAKGFFIGPLLLRCDDAGQAPEIHTFEVFAPCATLVGYADVDEALALVARGEGGLVGSLYSDDRELVGRALVELAPYHGRLFFGSRKVADVATPPGMVLPGCVHGGPGRAGGGEELGGLRGLDLYLQRTAVQGDRGLIERALS